MRSALLYGGIASFVLVAGLLLATPSDAKGYANATSFAGGVPAILPQLLQWLQDFFLVMVISPSSPAARLSRSRSPAGLPLLSRQRTARRQLDEPHLATFPHAVQRTARRRTRACALHPACEHQPGQGRPHPAVHLPCRDQRPHCARLVWCLRDLPAVPADRDRLDDRASPWMATGRNVPTHSLGLAGEYRSRRPSCPDADQRHRPDGPQQPPRRPLQPRLHNVGRDASDRAGRRGLLPSRPAGPAPGAAHVHGGSTGADPDLS